MASIFSSTPSARRGSICSAIARMSQRVEIDGGWWASWRKQAQKRTPPCMCRHMGQVQMNKMAPTKLDEFTSNQRELPKQICQRNVRPPILAHTTASGDGLHMTWVCFFRSSCRAGPGARSLALAASRLQCGGRCSAFTLMGFPRADASNGPAAAAATAQSPLSFFLLAPRRSGLYGVSASGQSCFTQRSRRTTRCAPAGDGRGVARACVGVPQCLSPCPRATRC